MNDDTVEEQQDTKGSRSLRDLHYESRALKNSDPLKVQIEGLRPTTNYSAVLEVEDTENGEHRIVTEQYDTLEEASENVLNGEPEERTEENSIVNTRAVKPELGFCLDVNIDGLDYEMITRYFAPREWREDNLLCGLYDILENLSQSESFSDLDKHPVEAKLTQKGQDKKLILNTSYGELEEDAFLYTERLEDRGEVEELEEWAKYLKESDPKGWVGRKIEDVYEKDEFRLGFEVDTPIESAEFVQYIDIGPYEKLVENLGGGDPYQIEDEKIYVRPMFNNLNTGEAQRVPLKTSQDRFWEMSVEEPYSSLSTLGKIRRLTEF